MADIRLFQNASLSSPGDADIVFTAQSGSTPQWIESQSTFGQILNTAFSTNSLGANIATTGSHAVNIGTGSYSGTISLGNSSSTFTCLGTCNINNSGSANTSINMTSGTLTVGTTNLFAGNGGNVSILNGSSNGGNFSVLANVNGTNLITFGNDTGPTLFNTHGTININTSGSSAVNIGTGSYSGQLNINNTSNTKPTNINGDYSIVTGTINGGSSYIAYDTVTSTTHYTTGTMSLSGTTLTGVGTSFSSTMVGGLIVFASGNYAIISKVASNTSLTIYTTTGGASEPSQTTNIYYGSSVTLATGNINAFCGSSSFFLPNSATSLNISLGNNTINLDLSALSSNLANDYQFPDLKGGVAFLATSTRATVTQTSTISTGVTLTGTSGIITTVSLTTAASTTAGTFTITDTLYTSAIQVIQVSTEYGSSTTGTPYAFVSSTTPGSNTFNITVRNIDTSAAFNGTLKIHVLIS